MAAQSGASKTADDRSNRDGRFSVGETVRIELPALLSQPKKRRQRCGIVATQTTDEACVLLTHPNEILSLSGFIISPTRKVSLRDIDEQEITVPLSRVHARHSFETQQDQSRHDDATSAALEHWKSCGDTLMKLGDELSALLYYERALKESSPLGGTIQIGSTVLLRIPTAGKEGNYQIWVAEIDCVEDDSKGEEISVDVTVVARLDPFQNRRSLREEEQSIVITRGMDRDKTPCVLLNLLNSHNNFVQERILLNFSRCLLQLASEMAEGGPHHDPGLASNCLKPSILTATMVDALATYHQQHNEDDDNPMTKGPSHWQATSVLLRARAWLQLAQYDLAMADIKRLQKLGSEFLLKNPAIAKEAQYLGQKIQQQRDAASRQTRKMVKDICQWIDGATIDPPNSQNAANDSSFSGKSLFSP